MAGKATLVNPPKDKPGKDTDLKDMVEFGFYGFA